MISLDHTILPLNHQILMNHPSYPPPPHHPPHFHPPRFHLPHALQLALLQVDALGEQVGCDGQGDSAHPPAPSHVRVVRDGTSGRGGALDMPSSWRGGSVDGGYLHLEGDE